jgi:streptogramin lyase
MRQTILAMSTGNKLSKYCEILICLLLFVFVDSALSSSAGITNAADGKAKTTSNGYKFLATWPDNQWLFNIADIAADGKGNFYIVDKASNEIKIYNKNGKLITQWPTGYTGTYNSPAGYHIAVDKDGFIYVAESINNCIKKFNSQGKLRAKWGSEGEGNGQFTFMRAITVDDNGYMYVIDGSRVQKLDYRGRFVAAWGKNKDGGNAPGEFDLPTDIVAGKDGNIYVSDSFNGRIQKLTADGKFIMQFGNFKSGNDFGDGPEGITVDKDDNVYVVDVTNSMYHGGVFGCYIQKYDSGGKFLFQFGDYKDDINNMDPNSPGLNGIAVDGSGNIYTANLAAGFECVEKYSAMGKKLVRWRNESNGNGKFNQPTDIALDTKGNVYVADRINKRVQKFSASGKYLTQW